MNNFFMFTVHRMTPVYRTMYRIDGLYHFTCTVYFVVLYRLVCVTVSAYRVQYRLSYLHLSFTV